MLAYVILFPVALVFSILAVFAAREDSWLRFGLLVPIAVIFSSVELRA